MYGLSHSEILGSKVICTYPKLIAAYHVLHRLCEPRHPPYALSYFFLYRFISFSVIQIKRTVAHTFSCIVSWTIASSRYSFACVNMSKILLAYLTLLKVDYLKWRITDSNRWPPACKAGALASWANPPNFFGLRRLEVFVVPGRLELPTSTLSVWRSNQLSYRTIVPGWLTVQDFWACIFEPGFLFLLYIKQVL